MWRSLSILTIAGGLLSTTGLAFGQTNSLFSTQGPASQIGSNARGSAAGGSTTFGQFGTSTGMTGFGASGVGGGGLSTSFGGNVVGGQTQGTGQTTRSTFVGRSDNAGRFVGQQLAGQQTGRNAANFNFGNRGNGRSGRSFNQESGGGRSGSDRQRMIRPRLQVGFTQSLRTSTAIETALNRQFTRLSTQDERVKAVEVVPGEDGVVILRGEVDSEDTRKLAAIMARMEPGVRSVQNELQVAAE